MRPPGYNDDGVDPDDYDGVAFDDDDGVGFDEEDDGLDDDDPPDDAASRRAAGCLIPAMFWLSVGVVLIIARLTAS